MTNATKAGVILVVNSLLILVAAFAPDLLNDTKQAAIEGTVNAVLGLWVVLTYKNSAKRIPE